MNNHGQSIFLSIIIAIFIFMVGMLMMNFINPEKWNDGTDSFMTQLNCGTASSPNLSVSDGTQATCLIGEVIHPYFIIAVISAAGGLIVSRLLL